MLIHTCCVWLASTGPMACWLERKVHLAAGGREHKGLGSMGGWSREHGMGVGSTGGGGEHWGGGGTEA